MKNFPYKLGKAAARKGAIKFALTDYLDLTKFPKIPDTFGHEDVIKNNDWQVLGNDKVGNCVFAGAAHETMIWSRLGGNPANFNEAVTIQVYSEVTGYNAADPQSDAGTDMEYAAQYRRKTGILDANGVRHKVAAYLAINPGNLQQHLIAMYLFGAVGIGVRFPDSAMEAFRENDVWDVVPNSNIEGGHYVPLVAKRHYIECVTWGKIQTMTEEFFQRYNDESIVYLSEEMFINRKSPEGFDYDQLLTDLRNLKS